VLFSAAAGTVPALATEDAMRAPGLLAIAIGSWFADQGVLAEYREEPVPDGGTVSGTVTITGEVELPPPQPVYKHLEVCGTTVSDERLVVGPQGALVNAVVDLVDVAAGKPVARAPVVLDNRKCMFVPHVRDATIGQTLELRNSDPFVHDAHAWLGTRTLFNVGILPNHSKREVLNDAGIVHINCNVRHSWMHAYVFVDNDPYHAVTGADGRFAIEQVPPGTYTLRIWHEQLGSSERRVTVEPGKTATVDVGLQAAAVPVAEAP
jgi:hypothetical protein